MIHAISKLSEAKAELKRKIKEMNRIEKEVNEEFLSNIRYEYDLQLRSIQEAIEVLEDAHEDMVY